MILIYLFVLVKELIEMDLIIKLEQIAKFNKSFFQFYI